MPNAILIISPYRDHGTWVFDDPNTGLVREPFVSGVPEMIDRSSRTSQYQVCARAGRARRDVVPLRWPDDTGAAAMEGWLCPALFKYFDDAPATLSARAEPQSR